MEKRNTFSINFKEKYSKFSAANRDDQMYRYYLDVQVLLTIPTTSVFAPSVRRDSTISRYPFLQAQIKGVVPYCNRNQNLVIYYNSGNNYNTKRLHNYKTVQSHGLIKAVLSAVQPYLFTLSGVLTLAPFCIRIFTTSVCPRPAAQAKHVMFI